MNVVDRYTCQINLPGFGENGQKALRNAKVLVVGAGGLGCPVAQYLVAAGIGTLGIADGDVIQSRNLNRQILYTPQEIGLGKAVVAAQKLQLQNPDAQVVIHDIMLTISNASAIIEPYNIVVDCTDNFETRYLVNDICVKQGKVLVHGAIYQYEGQVATLNVKATSNDEFSANYRDIFPNANTMAIPNCHDGGVIPPLAGIIGCIQANEVLKYLIGSTELLINQLLILDGLTMRTTSIKAKTKGCHTLEKNHGTTLSSPSITKEEYLSDSEKYLLVDVRSIEERFTFHIGGFHMPLEQILTGGWKPVNKKPILLYCATGKRSATAVNKLLNEGISSVYSLENGIQNWQ